MWNIICAASNVQIDRNFVRVNGLLTTAALAAYLTRPSAVWGVA